MRFQTLISSMMLKVTSNIENVTNNNGISKTTPIIPKSTSKVDFSLQCESMVCSADASASSAILGIKKSNWSTSGESTIESSDSSNKIVKITFLEPSDTGYDIKLQMTDKAGLKHSITHNTQVL